MREEGMRKHRPLGRVERLMIEISDLVQGAGLVQPPDERTGEHSELERYTDAVADLVEARALGSPAKIRQVNDKIRHLVLPISIKASRSREPYLTDFSREGPDKRSEAPKRSEGPKRRPGHGGAGQGM